VHVCRLALSRVVRGWEILVTGSQRVGRGGQEEAGLNLIKGGQG
jgi:hypothetical protein